MKKGIKEIVMKLRLGKENSDVTQVWMYNRVVLIKLLGVR